MSEMATETHTEAGRRSANESDKKVGLRVKMVRVEQGISQERLGAHLGVTFQQVQKYERGTNRIATPRLVKIAGFLKRPVTFFLQDIDGSKIEGGTDKLVEFICLPGAVELIDAYLRMPPQARTQIVNIAKMVRPDKT